MKVSFRSATLSPGTLILCLLIFKESEAQVCSHPGLSKVEGAGGECGLGRYCGLNHDGQPECFHVPEGYGAACSNGYDCQGQLLCVDSTCRDGRVGDPCYSNADCQSRRCDSMWASSGSRCTARLQAGERCSKHTDCQSNFCSLSFKCDGAAKDLDNSAKLFWPWDQPAVDESIEIAWDGLDRQAVVHLPPEAKRQPTMPLVINLHAMASNPAGQSLLTGFDSIADREGFVVLYPQGYYRPELVPDWVYEDDIDQGWTFNAGGCCPVACKVKVDDVGFIRELVKYVSDTFAPERGFSIDTNRIYATGMSNGAFMAHRLGCELSDVVAAIAPVAGVMTEEIETFLWEGNDPYFCNPQSAPVPVLHIHDRFDELVSFYGLNPFLNFRSVPDSVDRWLEINGVSGARGVVTYDHDAFFGWCSKCTTYSSGRSEVILCEVLCGPHPFGHSWPGGPLGYPWFDASAYIWEFFKRHSLVE